MPPVLAAHSSQTFAAVKAREEGFKKLLGKFGEDTARNG